MGDDPQADISALEYRIDLLTVAGDALAESAAQWKRRATVAEADADRLAERVSSHCVVDADPLLAAHTEAVRFRQITEAVGD